MQIASQPATPIPEEVKDVREILTAAYLKEYQNLKRLHFFLHHRYVNAEDRLKLDRLIPFLESNVQMLQNAGEICQFYPGNCQQQRQVTSRLHPYELEFLKKALHFMDYCLWREAFPRMQPAIEALLQSTKQNDCAQAFSLLEKMDDLSLRNSRLENIAPLLSFSELTKLDLAHNVIADIAALRSLNHLAYLDVSYNRIDNPPSLIGFSALRVLSAWGNPMGNHSAIRSHYNSLAHLFLTDDEACAFERKRTLELKLIDRTTFEVMEQINFSPVYENGFYRQKVNGQFYCPMAAKTYTILHDW
jgi:Leucine-rich repeat (LRR) protein